MSLAAAIGELCNDQLVSVITSDGKILVGTLKDQGVERHPLGICVIRGENVALVGQIDRDVDLKLKLSDCKAKPLKPVVH